MHRSNPRERQARERTERPNTYIKHSATAAQVAGEATAISRFSTSSILESNYRTGDSEGTELKHAVEDCAVG
ncbi:unnamed protein product [Arctogadus glacialis]